MELKFQNRNNHQYEKLFNELIENVFGFSFSDWHSLELWDERYESYSIVENNKMLSNVCLFRVNLCINTENVTAYQLGAVATHTDHRGKGLSREILSQITEKYPNNLMFLFANERAVDFYPKFGFKRVYNSLALLPKEIDNPDILGHNLGMTSDTVKNYLYNGRPLSSQIDCLNTQPIVYFHFIMEYKNNIYHIPEIDSMVVAKQSGDNLFIPYINVPSEIDFDEICKRLPFSGVKTISFGFAPDNLNIDCSYKKLLSDNESMFVKGSIELPNQFVFPALAKT